MTALPPLLLGRLNHVGIACVSIDETIAMYGRLFGATCRRRVCGWRSSMSPTASWS
jgi:methylmalonyl-CoA/ethylmalonyl-CoA epimerase